MRENVMTNNKLISQTQTFRVGVLENISLGMVVIPYICVNIAGRWHFVAFLLGLLMAAAYMVAMYYLSKGVPENLPGRLMEGGVLGRGASILYALRYVLRAGLIMLFFGKTIQEFLLQSFSLWVIIITFILVCGYGASRDIEKRGRLLELLFPWMIIPIILVAVFSISSINLGELYSGLMGVNYNSLGQGADVWDVIKGGYVAFLVLSSTELMVFTLPHQREDNWRNTLKTGIWILISIILAYVFVIGILGGHWVASDSQSALNVMEAAFIPGEVIERADYPVIVFWVIGVFAIISGYMFYAKEACLIGTRLKYKKQGSWCLWVVMVAVTLLTWVWNQGKFSLYLAEYMLWADVAISLLVPVVLISRGGNKRMQVKRATLLVTVVLLAGFMTGCDSDDIDFREDNFNYTGVDQGSLEDRDYVTHITFKGDDEIIFTVADIKTYLSDATGEFDTKEERLREDSLQEAMEEYYEDMGRWLDLGHLSGMTFEKVEIDDLREYAMEMGNMHQLGKSVTVSVKADKDGQATEIPLRQLIKKAYAGENLP